MHQYIEQNFFKIYKKPENPQLVQDVDNAVVEILDLPNRKHTNRRNEFFPLLIDKLELEYGAEVGVFQGEFAKILIQDSKIKVLYGIDYWPKEELKQKTQETLKQYIEEGRSILVEGYSHKVAEKFEDNSLDFVYIDGDHSYEGTLVDLYAWTRKVRIGGIMSGHDFRDGRSSSIESWFVSHLRKRVKTSVCDFCQRHGYLPRSVSSICSNWFFTKNKELDPDRSLIETKYDPNNIEYKRIQ